MSEQPEVAPNPPPKPEFQSEYKRGVRRQGGWFTRKVLGRVNSKNNCLILVTGATGIGKSFCGLRLCEMFDHRFDATRICFNMREFLDLIPDVPSKSFILYDEAGVSVGHRTWLSPANMAISMVTQSFRYKFINVVFALPSRYYLDKVPRELCHYEIMMQRRGVGAVHSIFKSSYADITFTKFLGNIYIHLPSVNLSDEYERLREEHQNLLYEKLRKQQALLEKREETKLEEGLKPTRSFDEMLERARLILPQIINEDKATDQGKINVAEMRNLLHLPNNMAYAIRNELLKEIHAKEAKKEEAKADNV